MKPETLLSRGYFPDELPKAFTSREFADSVSSLSVTFPAKTWTTPVTLNLARPGTLRRRLSIPNPFSQRVLAELCASNWSILDVHLQKSPLSISRPTAPRTGRALRFSTPFSERGAERLRRIGNARYTVISDISDFYGSVYTHSLEWALHSKAVAKANLKSRGSRLLGGELDIALRNGQDGQTKGLPVGPDTSLLLSELVLCALDAELIRIQPRLQSAGIRFMDDLELAARSHSEAESALFDWDTLLSSYHLALNPRKTSIIRGPLPPEAPWRTALAQFRIRSGSDRVRANDLQSYVSHALKLASEYPGSAVLGYALRGLRPTPSNGKSWAIFADFLLTVAVAEPSSIRYVARTFQMAARDGLPIDRDRVAETLNDVCSYHAPLEHGSEVVWAMRILKGLGLPITAEAASAVSKMSDNCSLILLFDFIESSQVSGTTPDMSATVARAEDPITPNSEDWLLGYECARNGWSSPAAYAASPHWAELLGLGVRFYISQGPVTTSTPPTSNTPIAPAPGETDPPNGTDVESTEPDACNSASGEPDNEQVDGSDGEPDFPYR